MFVAMGAPQAAPGAVGGFLSLRTPFELQVYEGGRLLGTTSTERLMLPTGRHELELVGSSFQFKRTLTVNIEAGKVASPAVAIPSGSLSINALPWAEVFVDGRSVGTTPLANLSVPIGNHEVVWRHPATRRAAADGGRHGADAGTRWCEPRSMKRIVFAGTTLILVLVAIPLHAADLASAKALYASASYEEALTMLASLEGNESVEQVNQIRALCLLALGRSKDAEQAVEQIVVDNPTYQLENTEVSPKLVTLFHDVRRRALPAATRALYAKAKSSYDQTQLDRCAARFRRSAPHHLRPGPWRSRRVERFATARRRISEAERKRDRTGPAGGRGAGGAKRLNERLRPNAFKKRRQPHRHRRCRRLWRRFGADTAAARPQSPTRRCIRPSIQP